MKSCVSSITSKLMEDATSIFRPSLSKGDNCARLRAYLKAWIDGAEHSANQYLDRSDTLSACLFCLSVKDSVWQLGGKIGRQLMSLLIK